MIDLVLFAGRIVLIVLLYIFLFAVMKTGVGLVRGQRRDSAIWTIESRLRTRASRCRAPRSWWRTSTRSTARS